MGFKASRFQKKDGAFGMFFLVQSWVDLEHLLNFARQPNLSFCQRISDACRLTVWSAIHGRFEAQRNGEQTELETVVKAEYVPERLQVTEAVLAEHQQLCSSQER